MNRKSESKQIPCLPSWIIEQDGQNLKKHKLVTQKTAAVPREYFRLQFGILLTQFFCPPPFFFFFKFAIPRSSLSPVQRCKRCAPRSAELRGVFGEPAGPRAAEKTRRPWNATPRAAGAAHLPCHPEQQVEGTELVETEQLLWLLKLKCVKLSFIYNFYHVKSLTYNPYIHT